MGMVIPCFQKLQWKYSTHLQLIQSSRQWFCQLLLEQQWIINSSTICLGFRKLVELLETFPLLSSDIAALIDVMNILPSGWSVRKLWAKWGIHHLRRRKGKISSEEYGMWELHVPHNHLFVNLTSQNVLNAEESHLEAISPSVHWVLQIRVSQTRSNLVYFNWRYLRC